MSIKMLSNIDKTRLSRLIVKLVIFVKSPIVLPKTCTLHPVFEQICQATQCELLSCETDDTSVSLIIAYPTTKSVASLVNTIKGVSSRKLRPLYAPNANRYWEQDYIALSIST